MLLAILCAIQKQFMLHDLQGLEVTTDSSRTIAQIDRFIDQSLSYGRNAEQAILAAVVADPTCAIAHAYAAAYFLSQETATAWKQAMPYLMTAQHYAAKTTEREQWYIQAIAAWANRDFKRAIALHEAIAKQYPRDLISVQQGQYHYFYQGDAKQLLQIAQQVLSANSDRAYLQGMIAFGLEQCGFLTEAETVGRRAVKINRCDPWAQHAVAHVLEVQQRPAAGIAWMESHAHTWEECNSMLYTHNWWHVALYYLTLGDWQKVLQLYDTHIWGRADKTASKDQVGAIATLLRLELQGVDVGDRWKTITPYLRSRLQEHAIPFQDLHYVYALTRSECTGWATEMLRSLEVYVAQLDPVLQPTWGDVVLPAARGMVAHAKGNWSGAIAELQPVLSRLYKVGGSRTQQKLFMKVYQDALLKHEQLKQCNITYFSGSQSRQAAVIDSGLGFVRKVS